MSKKLIRRDVDLAHLPLLTEKQKAELDALAAREGGGGFREEGPSGEIDRKRGDAPGGALRER